jgi:hypothetical protein
MAILGVLAAGKEDARPMNSNEGDMSEHGLPFNTLSTALNSIS